MHQSPSPAAAHGTPECGVLDCLYFRIAGSTGLVLACAFVLALFGGTSEQLVAVFSGIGCALGVPLVAKARKSPIQAHFDRPTARAVGADAPT